MNCEMRNDAGDCVVLMLEGDLTIQNARELREAVLRAQETAASLSLNLEKVTAADVSCLQVLCSAHRTLVKSRRRMSLLKPLPAPFVRSVQEAGFERERGCALDSHHTCLWCIGGDHEQDHHDRG
ncbi:MAG: STAS domain-containing protein [Thermodesulfobacteriota bacterium]